MEITPLFVSNEKLLLNFVFSFRTFVFYEKKVSYARILREESLIFALNEKIRFNSQCLKRYTNYSNSISFTFASELKHISFVVAAASHFVNAIK